ncbi:MAG: hypothetical protein JSW71_04530 [Gemmatimonadota bacterium]|nr:MAG: hypothetical protein JSW71_04530 [Gemmatimonadota bacterium]
MNTRLLLALGVAVLALSTGGCPICPEGSPNLAVVRIDYEIIETTSATSGTVRVTGVITNSGTSTYDSGAGQQSIQLYEGSNLQQAPVAQTDFEDLAAGATLTVTYETEWSTSNEFIPDYYVLLINLDPDLHLDGNEANDECPATDNLLSRPGSEVNDLPGWGS